MSKTTKSRNLKWTFKIPKSPMNPSPYSYLNSLFPFKKNAAPCAILCYNALCRVRFATSPFLSLISVCIIDCPYYAPCIPSSPPSRTLSKSCIGEDFPLPAKEKLSIMKEKGGKKFNAQPPSAPCRTQSSVSVESMAPFPHPNFPSSPRIVELPSLAFLFRRNKVSKRSSRRWTFFSFPPLNPAAISSTPFNVTMKVGRDLNDESS